MSPETVLSGLDILAAEKFERIKGKRVGVLAHQASVDRRLRHMVDLLLENPQVQLSRIFAPEHGFEGSAQDQAALEGSEERRKVPVVNLYGSDFDSLWPKTELLRDLDLLIVDLQDIGSRYYTFYTTMVFCLERAALAGTPVLILDRPNPIGGAAVEGPINTRPMRSFVGYYELPVRHGLTLGELAEWANSYYSLGARLRVIPVRGWRRDRYFDQTGLPWVLPSPNMPSLETALVYPGACLLEGTNLSEGRGTTKPFELFGAPYLNADELVRRMSAEKLLGVGFRPTRFIPTFHKWAGRICHGMQVHVLDRQLFKPWLTYVLILRHIFDMHPEDFAWRTETYEFVSDRPAIDLLLGDPKLREAIENGASRADFEVWGREAIMDFERSRRAFALYSYDTTG